MKPLKKKNEEGFAILEAVVFLMSFMVLAVYTIDFFSAIHTGVLGSIHSRTYLFETLRHRSDIDILREGAPKVEHMATDKHGHERFHGINDEDQPLNDTSQMRVVGRALTAVGEQSEGNLAIGGLGLNNAKPTSVLYIKSGYGICTDSKCRRDGG